MTQDSPCNDSAALKEFDKLNARLRAHQFLFLQYPANDKSGMRVLSFHFGIRAIVLGSLKIRCIEFDMLALIVNRNLFESCVKTVQHILSKYDVDVYVNDLNLAFNLLRDKHILSVICKVLLLPLITCWFRGIGNGEHVMMKGPLVKSKHTDIIVKVAYIDTGGRDQFMDIERVDNFDGGCIDYFYKH
jgi:hypothetical protein